MSESFLVSLFGQVQESTKRFNAVLDALDRLYEEYNKEYHCIEKAAKLIEELMDLYAKWKGLKERDK